MVAADIATILLADHIKALAPKTREQRYFAFRAAGWTKMLLLLLPTALFRCFCFLFCHVLFPSLYSLVNAAVVVLTGVGV
jgi:hypothetical protein